MNWKALIALSKFWGPLLITESQDSRRDYFVRGINFGRAIENHDGDIEFIVNLTGDFIDIYGKSDKKVTQFLKDKNLEQAERLLHNIAGLSGTFGADQLMNSARVLEHQLIDHGQAMAPAQENFSADLQNFNQAIEEFKLMNLAAPRTGLL